MKLKKTKKITASFFNTKIESYFNKKYILIVCLFFSTLGAAQNPVNTPYFTLNGSYQDVQKEQNDVAGYKAYNYSFMSTDNNEYYMIAVMKYNKNSGYLDEIINSSPKKYLKINFQGQSGITSESEVMSQGSLLYVKDIMFFRNNYFFSVLLTAQNRKTVNYMFLKFQKNFKSK